VAEHAATYTSDPLTSPQARDWAVRDYRMWLLRDGPAKRSRVYVSSTFTALDDFHTRLGLGKANVSREELPKNAPRALEERARIRWSSLVTLAQTGRLDLYLTAPVCCQRLA
jgi:integrase/recombinase XerC